MALADAIRDRVRTGLLRGYVVREEESMVVRGRLDVSETVRRRPSLTLPLVQTPELLEEDIIENRLLATAVEALIPRVGSPGARSRLMECRRLFHNVSLFARGHSLPRVTRSRFNERWWGAIELAALVLKCCGLDLPSGHLRARSFLVDMNLVFERFVRRSLTAALRAHALSLDRGTKALYLDTDLKHRLVPDLSVWRGPRCVFAGDCKYKHSLEAKAHRSDVYQALAYAVAAGLPSTMLIYGEGETRSRDVRIVAGPIVKVRVLDLAAPAESMKAQLQQLAAEIALDSA